MIPMSRELYDLRAQTRLRDFSMLDFKALLFDLDGTLLDTAPDFITALNKQLSLHGREPLPDHAIRTSVTNGSVGLIQSGFGIDPGPP